MSTSNMQKNKYTHVKPICCIVYGRVKIIDLCYVLCTSKIQVRVVHHTIDWTELDGLCDYI